LQDLTFFRPTVDGTWRYVYAPSSRAPGYLNGAEPLSFSEQFGTTNDRPIPGWDIDGDGKSDPVVYRESQGATQLGTLFVYCTSNCSFANTSWQGRPVFAFNAGYAGNQVFFSKARYHLTGRFPALWVYDPKSIGLTEYPGGTNTTFSGGLIDHFSWRDLSCANGDCELM
jgi:hypothetical protein